MHLEVTTDNTAAIRLYERLGFKRAKVVFKAAEVAGCLSSRVVTSQLVRVTE